MRPMPSPGRSVVHRLRRAGGPSPGAKRGAMRSRCSPFGGQRNRPLSTCRGALLHGFRHWARQATVTDRDAQSVIGRLLCAHNAEYALVHRMLSGAAASRRLSITCPWRSGRAGVAVEEVGARQGDRLPGGRTDRHRADVGARISHRAAAVASLVGALLTRSKCRSGNPASSAATFAASASLVSGLPVVASSYSSHHQPATGRRRPGRGRSRQRSSGRARQSGT